MAELNYDKLPNQNLRDSVKEYIERGRPLGHDSFLCNLVRNDLKGTCRKADDVNQRLLFELVSWFWNHAPAGCWGSASNYCSWVKNGGLQGLMERDQLMRETDV